MTDPSTLPVAVVLASRVTELIRSASGPWVYVLAFVMTFAETGTLLFVVPGEITLVLAGIAASSHEVSLPLLLVLASAAAVLGDATGFWIGRHFGRRLRTSRLGSKMSAEHWDRTERVIRRRRGLVVLVGRWVGFLRALMPATAGMSGLDYRREFLPYDLVGSISWAVLCVLGGYTLGEKAERYLGWIALGLGAAIVLAALVWIVRRAMRTRRAPGLH